MKIYSDDPLVHYKNSTISPDRSRAEIDWILATWQVKDTYWHWDPDHNDVFVQFKLKDEINGVPVDVSVKVVCPMIWDRERPRARPPQLEQINWKISLRAMWWFIKTHLEMSYVMHSDKVTAFLPYIQTSKGKSIAETILSRLGSLNQLEYLPEEPRKPRIIEAEEPTIEKGENP